jgi:hypothetical protein
VGRMPDRTRRRCGVEFMVGGIIRVS